MEARILICVACKDRRAIAEQCLPTIAESKRSQDFLTLWDDGSTTYEEGFLQQWADKLYESKVSRGIEIQRRAHLDTFWQQRHAFTHLYFSDIDALMDPSWRENLLSIQGEAGGALTCGYNTRAHSEMTGNTIDDNPKASFIWRHFAPGISYLLTREHVERVMPHLLELTAFDWQIPAILGYRCAVSRTSYVDHIGYGGIRHPEGAGINEGDKCETPTDWLRAKRAEVVKELST